MGETLTPAYQNGQRPGNLWEARGASGRRWGMKTGAAACRSERRGTATSSECDLIQKCIANVFPAESEVREREGIQ